jgi:phospholipase/carboxylesterase
VSVDAPYASDRVVGTELSVKSASQLRQLGAQVTLDVVPGLGHGIDAKAAALVLDYVARLKSLPHSRKST